VLCRLCSVVKCCQINFRTIRLLSVNDLCVSLSLSLRKKKPMCDLAGLQDEISSAAELPANTLGGEDASTLTARAAQVSLSLSLSISLSLSFSLSHSRSLSLSIPFSLSVRLHSFSLSLSLSLSLACPPLPRLSLLG